MLSGILVILVVIKLVSNCSNKVRVICLNNIVTNFLGNEAVALKQLYFKYSYCEETLHVVDKCQRG